MNQIIDAPTVPSPTATLCYVSAPGDSALHCDRKQGHKGLHSWSIGPVIKDLREKIRVCQLDEGTIYLVPHLQPILDALTGKP